MFPYDVDEPYFGKKQQLSGWDLEEEETFKKWTVF